MLAATESVEAHVRDESQKSKPIIIRPRSPSPAPAQQATAGGTAAGPALLPVCRDMERALGLLQKHDACPDVQARLEEALEVGEGRGRLVG